MVTTWHPGIIKENKKVSLSLQYNSNEYKTVRNEAQVNHFYLFSFKT